VPYFNHVYLLLFQQVKAVKGLSWGHAAIGNATWSGARLTDVLKYVGYTANEKDAHVKV